MNDFCERCGTQVETEHLKPCAECFTPYCSDKCRSDDANDQHQPNNNTGLCLSWKHKHVVEHMKFELCLSESMRFPFVGNRIPVLFFPGPISGPVPKAMQLYTNLKPTDQTIRKAAKPYYVVKVRDMPRVWLRQLNNVQKNELQSAVNQQMNQTLTSVRSLTKLQKLQNLQK